MTRILMRRGREEEWLEANPVLNEGEFGVSLDTKRFKIGNGFDDWVTLPYVVDENNLPTPYTDELAQDAAWSLFNNQGHTGIEFFYNDALGSVVANVTDTTVSQEQVQDAVAPMFVDGTNSGISFFYDDTNNKINAVVTGQFTVEEAQDAVYAMLAAGNQQGILVTYNDAGNKLDMVVKPDYIIDAVFDAIDAGVQTGVEISHNVEEGTLSFNVTGGGQSAEEVRVIIDEVMNVVPGGLITKVSTGDGTFRNIEFGIDLSNLVNIITDNISASVSSFVANNLSGPGLQNLEDEDGNYVGFTLNDSYVRWLVGNVLENGLHPGLNVLYDADNQTVDLSVKPYLPEFISEARTKTYNRYSHLYNVESTKKLRYLLAEAAVGGSLVPFSWIGDSIRAGHKGTPGVNDSVTLLRKMLLEEGYPITGGWVYPANGTTRDSRWSITGTWSDAGSTFSNFLDTVQVNATATFAETLPGTVVEFSVFCTSTTTITYSVDGSSAQSYSVSPGAVRKIQVTGLIDTTHSLTVTYTGSGAAAQRLWIGPARTRRTTGLSMSNGAIFGSLATDWLPTAISSAWYNPYNIMMALEVPKLVVVGLGANEMINVPSATPASLSNTLFGIGSSLESSGSNFVYNSYPPSIADTKLSGHSAPNNSMTPWLNVFYEVAENKNVPLIDHYSDFGTQADFKAAGLGWTDDIHMLPPGNMAVARRELSVFRSVS